VLVLMTGLAFVSVDCPRTAGPPETNSSQNSHRPPAERPRRTQALKNLPITMSGDANGLRPDWQSLNADSTPDHPLGCAGIWTMDVEL
jgi:hypothetical protein